MRAAKVAILTVCLLAGAGAVPAHAAGPNKNEAEGRRHARKANQLADLNKCKAAIPEYTRAIRLLKDPTLLFNRAECYRRTGEATKAVADYRKFLIQLPSAPNRGQVESQIAALDKKSGRAATAATAPAARPAIASAPARAPAPRPAAVAPAAASKPTPMAEDRAPVEPSIDERSAESPPATRAPPSAPALAESPGPMALVDTQASPGAATGASSGSSYWWIWVLGAVVVVGAGAGTYFAIKQGATDIPPSALGNYRF